VACPVFQPIEPFDEIIVGFARRGEQHLVFEAL
jgi:hypothetical protein